MTSIFCFLSFLNASASNFQINNNNIDFILSDFEIEKVNNYDKINMNNKTGDTGLIGMPKLPLYSTLIMVNPAKDYKIEYNVKESYVLENIKIIPNQGLHNGLEKENTEDIDLNFYNSSGKYPYNNITISEPMIMRDLVLLNLSIIPFNYIPPGESAGSLYFY